MRLLQVAFVIVLALGCFGARVRAEDAADYPLGPNDVIEINVQDHDELNRVTTIRQDGKITIPDVGEVLATGKTPEALASDIQAKLNVILVDPVVSVNVREMHSRQVRVIGAVRAGGSYDLKPGWRLLDLVIAAGGFVTKPSLVSGRLIRDDTKVITFDAAQAIAKPESPSNLKLEPKDLVIFDEKLEPERTPEVHVMGQVGRSGAFDLTPGLSILTLIAQAGGPTDHAALTEAYVLRGTTQLPLDLRPILVEGKPDQAVTSFKLQGGDVLFVPEIKNHYAVLGEAGKPGNFVIPEKGSVTVMQAVNLAGAAQTADLSRVEIVRTVDGKPTTIPINIPQMLKKHDLAANQVMQPNDVLYIPPKGRHGFGLADLLSPLLTLRFLGFGL